MDSYPDALAWVAPSIESFAELIRPDDDWLLRSDARIARARKQAKQRRAAEVTLMTADGMGIVEPGAGKAPKVPKDFEGIRTILLDLVARKSLVEALTFARNAIARRGPQPPGFGKAVAAVYAALNRPEYAKVALKSYEFTPAFWDQIRP